jgi:hypothetical protein
MLSLPICGIEAFAVKFCCVLHRTFGFSCHIVKCLVVILLSILCTLSLNIFNNNEYQFNQSSWFQGYYNPVRSYKAL